MTDTKKTTDLTVAELKEAIGNMSDDELRDAYLAETETEGHTPRTGALTAIKDEADKREVARFEPGAGDQSDDVAELKAKVAELEQRLADRGSESGGEVSREEVLKLHRRVESLATHLNFRLPS